MRTTAHSGGITMAEHICPWWLGYFHLGPLRRLMQNPKRILSPHIKSGMTVLDVGCGMGFFTLDMARLVGPNGRVVAIDLQPRMIKTLVRRAKRVGLSELIDMRICSNDSLQADDLAGSIDFAAAFNVVHEVPDIPSFMREIHSLLVRGGRFLVVEPKGHVNDGGFEGTTATAREAGFEVVERPTIRRSRSVLLQKD